jgi:uncharacterized protein (DUF1778 family)
MEVRMRARDEIRAARFTKREAAIVEQAAKAGGVTLSEYLRSAALTTAVMQGNAEAVKLMGAYALEQIAAMIKKNLPEEHRVVLG